MELVKTTDVLGLLPAYAIMFYYDYIKTFHVAVLKRWDLAFPTEIEYTFFNAEGQVVGWVLVIPKEGEATKYYCYKKVGEETEFRLV